MPSVARALGALPGRLVALAAVDDQAGQRDEQGEAEADEHRKTNEKQVNCVKVIAWAQALAIADSQHVEVQRIEGADRLAISAWNWSVESESQCSDDLEHRHSD